MKVSTIRGYLKASLEDLFFNIIMYSQYKIVDVLAKKVGGPYALSTILIKRARQILKGEVHMLGQEKSDPVQGALEDFVQDALAIGEGEVVSLEEKEGDKGSK